MQNFWGEEGGLPFGRSSHGRSHDHCVGLPGIEGACAMSGSRETSLLTSARQRSFPSAAFWRSNLVVSILGMGILPRRAAGGTVQPQSGGHHGSRRRPLGRRAYQLRCHPFASGSHAGLYRLDFRGPVRSGASRCVHEELRGHEQEGRALCARSSFPRSSSKRSSC